MSIPVTCAKCGVTLKVKEAMAGTKGKCPACGRSIYVPTLEELAGKEPIGPTETRPERGVEDTGAHKTPDASRQSRPSASAAKANPSDAGPSKSSAAIKSDPKPPAETPPADKPSRSRSTTPETAERAGGTPPKPIEPSSRKPEPPAPRTPPKNRNGKTSETDDAAPPAPPSPASPPQPVAEKPAEPAPPPPAAEEAAAPAEEEIPGFDLDEFLAAGPKPKALPPLKDEPPKGPSGRNYRRQPDIPEGETNVTGMSETLPPANKGKPTTAEAAAAALSGTTTASADTKARLQELADRPSLGQRISRAGKTFFRYYALPTLGVLAVGGAIGWYALSIARAPDLPPLAATTGIVTVDKKPIAGAVVTLVPIGGRDAKTSEKQRTASGKPPHEAKGTTDASGRFEARYEEGIAGAVVGRNRIWIDPKTPDNKKKIPQQYQSPSTSSLIKDVKATGNDFVIEL